MMSYLGVPDRLDKRLCLGIDFICIVSSFVTSIELCSAAIDEVLSDCMAMPMSHFVQIYRTTSELLIIK